MRFNFLFFVHCSEALNKFCNAKTHLHNIKYKRTSSYLKSLCHAKIGDKIDDNLWFPVQDDTGHLFILTWIRVHYNNQNTPTGLNFFLKFYNDWPINMFQFFFENVKIVKASAVFEFKTKIFVVNTSTIALRCKVTLVGKKKILGFFVC